MPRDLATPEEACEWLLKRNCSLAPRQLAQAYGVLWLLSFSVALGFALQGYWMIPVFSLLEMLAVTVALLYYARHATDHEHIALVDGVLLISHVSAGRVRRTRLIACWTRVLPPARPRDLIWLEARGVRVAVGRFVSEAVRRRVAQELRQCLAGGLTM